MLAVTSVAVFMSFLDVTVVNIAFPDLRADFSGGSLTALSWVISGYSIAFAVALVPVGRLADRVGRRRVFLAGIVVFLAASAVCGLAPDPGTLVAARVVQALGAAAIVPTSLALLLPAFPARQRATATAIWGAAGAVAAATGPVVGGLLVQWGGWRWVFLINLPIGLAVLVPAWRRLAESRGAPEARFPDVWGALLLGAGIATLTLGVIQGPVWGWGDPRTLAGFVAAVATLSAFLWRCAHHPAPIVDLRLFRVRSFAVANLATVVFNAGFYALLLANVLYLTGVQGYGVLAAGAALTPGAVVAAVVGPLSGAAADRFGQRAVALPGALLFAAGAGWLALTAAGTGGYATTLLPGLMATGAGIGLVVSSLSSAAVAELPRQRFATGAAVTACLRQVGSVLGVAVLLAVLGGEDPANPPAVQSFQVAWWAIAATGVVAAVCALALGRVRALETSEPAPPLEARAVA